MEDRNQELPQQDNSEGNNAEESPEDDLEDDHKVDWSTLKVYLRSKPRTLDPDGKLSEEEIFQMIQPHTGEDRAQILADMVVTVGQTVLSLPLTVSREGL